MSADLGYYDTGPTPFFACRSDQRFSYCLYVPRDYQDRQTDCRLAIVVHGTRRTAERYRDEFAAFAEAHDCIVLAPLFPAGIVEPYELESYKWIEDRGIRFDTILLAMVDEVADRYRIDGERFLLHGFSGGGHFAHRFFYLHARRLLGLSIGAPGMITLLDATKPWWIGTHDVRRRFGVASSSDELRAVPVQMVIGADDNETWEINNSSGPRWMDGADAAGTTRLERLSALRTSFEAAGIGVRHDIMPGVGHQGYELLEPVRSFFATVLESRRQHEVSGTAGR